MERKYVLGIDPSGAFKEGKGTTGMCLISKAKRYRLDKIWEIKAINFATPEAYWYEHVRRIEQLRQQHPNLIISIEDYILYKSKAIEQINSSFETPQLIGVIKTYCWLNNIPLYIRPAVAVKARWADEILEYKGILTSKDNAYYCKLSDKALSPHIKDSIRHAMHCLAFELNKNKRG